MALHLGDVVWGPDPFKSGVKPRPWLILSNENHPFHGEEYVAAALTTSQRPGLVELSDADWVTGGSPRKSFVSPWTVTTLKHRFTQEKQGTLRPGVVRAVVEELESYLGEK